MVLSAGKGATKAAVVMVSDPDPRTTRALKKVLKGPDFEVIPVGGSLEIKDRAGSTPPSLLVLCVDDPIWRDVLRTMQSSAKLRSVPLLLTTNGSAASELLLAAQRTHASIVQLEPLFRPPML